MPNEREIEQAPLGAIEQLEIEQQKNAQLTETLHRLQQRLFERDQGDSAISEENILYRAIFDAQSDLGEGMFIVDGRQIVQVNSAFTRISGFSPDELKAMTSFLDVVPEDERETLRRRMAQRLQGQQVHDHYETTIVHKLGHRVNVEVAVKVIHLGNQPRIVAIARDITERKRMEAALHDQNQRLQELDVLKNSFISTVSHELRTPLAVIMGYTEFLDERIGGPLSPDQACFVSQIFTGAKRLEVLVDDLLDFAKLEAGTLRLHCQELDLVQIVRSAATRFQPLALDLGITFEVLLPEEPVRLPMDSPRISQVLANLLSNAFKFTSAGGHVRLGVAVEGGAARVEIQDTGIGISREHLPYLFERFYQIDPSTTRLHGGAGLGLSISKALIESHGGRIGVMSQLNQGSTFWFTLPLNGSTRHRDPASETHSD